MSAKKMPRAGRPNRRKSAPGKQKDPLAELVKVGTEGFILKEAPIGDFQRVLRAASAQGKISSGPLTGAAFRRIVKQLIKERERRAGLQSRH